MNKLNLPSSMRCCAFAKSPLVMLPVALIIAVALGDVVSAAGFGPRNNSDETKTRLGPLVNVIMSTIKPATWDEVGGHGSIQAVDAWGLIVVSQTLDVHEKISWLLHSVRQARRHQGSGTEELSEDREMRDAKHSMSFAAESSTEACKRRHIETVLSSETQFEFVETALSDVAKRIHEQHSLLVILDKAGLDDVGIKPEVQMTANLKGISLRSALRIMLDQLDLSYIVQDEVLQITSREKAESHRVIRVYPVEDLAVVANTTASSDEANGKAAE